MAWTTSASRGETKSRLRAWIFIFLMAYFLFLCWVGFYAFPNEDDYSLGLSYRIRGLWGTEKQFYLNWSGRYLSNGAIAALGNLNDAPWVYHLIPGLELTAFLVLTFGLIREINQSRSFKHNAFLALAVFCGFLAGLKSLNECLYFLAGSATYFWGMIFSLVTIRLFIRLHKNKGLSVPGALMLASSIILGTGTNEMAALGTTFLAILLALLAVLKKTRLRPWLIGFAVLAICCFLLSYLAPGNFARSGAGTLETTIVVSFDNILKILWISAAEMFEFTTRWIFFTPLAPLLWVFVHVFRPNNDWLMLPGLSRRANLGLAALLWLGLTFTAIFVTCFALSGSLPARTLASIQFIFVAGAFYLFLLGFDQVEAFIQRRFSHTKVGSSNAVFLIFLAMMLAQKNVFLPAFNLVSGDFHEFRQGYIQRTETARNHKGEDVVFDKLPAYPYPVFYRELKTDPDDWANRAYARFWGLKSVRVRE